MILKVNSVSSNTSMNINLSTTNTALAVMSSTSVVQSYGQLIHLDMIGTLVENTLVFTTSQNVSFTNGQLFWLTLNYTGNFVNETEFMITYKNVDYYISSIYSNKMTSKLMSILDYYNGSTHKYEFVAMYQNNNFAILNTIIKESIISISETDFISKLAQNTLFDKQCYLITIQSVGQYKLGFIYQAIYNGTSFDILQITQMPNVEDIVGLPEALSRKQNVLSSGQGINIVDDTVSTKLNILAKNVDINY